MRMRFIPSFLLVGILVSCVNEDPSINQAREYANLEVGNYWVYEW